MLPDKVQIVSNDAHPRFNLVVGLVYAAMATGVILMLLVTAPTPARALPFTLYSAIAYGLGTTASLLVRWPSVRMP